MTRVPVQTRSKAYDVKIEHGLLRSAAQSILPSVPGARHIVVVTVPPVRKHWAKVFSESFQGAPVKLDFIEMEDGERRKNLDTVEDLAQQLVKLGADRSTVVVALGGGVVGDTAGFLASIYMRGIRFVQIPTTFLSLVDSSVGGKTGVNLTVGKNLIGTFKQPELVLADPQVLTTLPEREYRSGLYESLKAGIIRNAELFHFMESRREDILRREASALEWVIAESVRVKADVVGEDEEEHGVRRILNFGHTIGHALEAETGYKYFLHGEAVAWGMVAATMIGVGMQITSAQTAQRIIGSVLAYASLPKVDVRPRSIFKRLASDKKTLQGRVHFILPVEIGKVEVVDNVPEKAVLQAVEEVRTLSTGLAGL